MPEETEVVETEVDGTEASRGTGAKGLSTRLIVAMILGATLLASAGFALGRISTPTTITPTTTSAEAGFSRDMQTHHLQAVEMSMIIRDASEDPEIRLLAYDIATAQAHQAGQMFSWLTVWGLPQAAPEPSMTWMVRPALDGGGSGHDHGPANHSHNPGDPMPGLATNAQMDELKSLDGVEAEKLFLRLMIDHHIGGIDMAEAVLERSTLRAVTSLAAGMVAAQQSEVDYMEGLLAKRQ